MDYKFITSFLFGGLLLVCTYYAANYLNNTTLSAVITMLPLSIFSCYVIADKKLITSHLKNLIPVTILTILTFLIILAVLKYTNLNLYLIVTLSIIFWLLIQYLRAIFFPID